MEIQNVIRKKDYVFTREGIIVLSNELKNGYFDLLSEIFDRKRDYKARAGIRRKEDYQRMEEITIMKMKCLQLRDFILVDEQSELPVNHSVEQIENQMRQTLQNLPIS